MDLELPLYLASPQDFRTFLGAQFEGRTNTERGAKFTESALVYVQAQEWAAEFPNIRLNPKKAGEMGRDIISDANSDGRVLYVESKYSLEGVEQLDAVLSKWRQVDHDAKSEDQESLFSTAVAHDSLPRYALVSGLDVEGIVRRYESQPARGSRDFYDDLRREDRLRICGLNDIYRWLRTTYLRQHGIPSDFDLTSVHPWIRIGNVFLGAIQGGDLVELIVKNGEALFFENIRGWLGEKGEVNSTIMRTVTEEPGKFLERNNGITFRVQGGLFTVMIIWYPDRRHCRSELDQFRIDDLVNNPQGTEVSNGGASLAISRGNIINGCQTTMALWQCRPTDPDLFVQVKVVDAGDEQDAWKIAESANYQNQVTLLELKLAQHLRPQLVARHASRLGRSLNVDEPNSLESVLRAVSDSDSNYNLAKFLFLGLFSRKPNDLFTDNYERLNGGLIAAFYESRGDAESKLFEALFSLMEHGQRSLRKAAKILAKKDHSVHFARVFQEAGVKYRALVLLLAACGQLRVDLAAREDGDNSEAARINQFVDSLSVVLDTQLDEFDRSCKWALNTLFNDVARDNEDSRKIKQYLFSRIGDVSFSRLYQSLTRSLDLLSDGGQ